MSEESAVNGTDAEGRERPSWYVEFEPIPEDDHRTGAEVLLGTFRKVFGDEPPELSPELAAETEAFLNQFLVPRDD